MSSVQIQGKYVHIVSRTNNNLSDRRGLDERSEASLIIKAEIQQKNEQINEQTNKRT